MMNQLDGLTLTPLINADGELVYVIVTFQNAPGLELRLTGVAAEELRDGLTATVARARAGVKRT